MESNRILHYRYNFIYIIVILTLAIILLLTIKWTNLPNLVEYILFSLAITSITLSVITIIYAIFSNFSLSRSIYMINEASSSLEKSTSELEDSIELVNKNIINIPKKLTEVGKDIKKEIEPAVRTAIEKSQNELNTIDTVEEEGSKSVLKITKESLEHFLKYNSMHGVTVSYCAYLSHKNNAPLIYDEINKIIGGDLLYFHGQLIAQSSMGLFDHKVVKKGEWIIEEYDETLAKIIHKTYNKRIEKFIKENSEKDYMKGKEDEYRSFGTKLGELFKKSKTVK